MILMINSIPSFVYAAFAPTSNKGTFIGYSEASPLELLENIQEMSHWYYINSDVIGKFKFSAMQWCITCHKGVNEVTIYLMMHHNKLFVFSFIFA